MNTFQKILIGSVVLLMIINIILVSYIWRNRQGNPHRERRKREMRDEMLQRRLEMEHLEMEKLRSAFGAHEKEMEALAKGLRQTQQELRKSALRGDTARIRQLRNELEIQQDKVNQEVIDFFSNLSTDLEAEQKEKLEEMLNRERGRHRRRPH